MLCMYGGLVDAVVNAVLKMAKQSMSHEEAAKLGEQLAKGIRAAEWALVVWGAKAGSTPLKPGVTKAQSRQAAQIAAQDVKANAELIVYSPCKEQSGSLFTWANTYPAK